MSKKNRALLTFLQDRIIKKFRYQKDFLKELFIYHQHPDFCPDLLAEYDRCIEISYIEGQSLFENPLSSIPLAIESLIKFHKHIYMQEKSFIHYDTNPSNYILLQDKVYLIDFSEIKEGRKERDIISFFLYWIPILSIEQFQICFQKVYPNLREYQFTSKDLIAEIKRFNKRRQQYNNSEGLISQKDPILIWFKNQLGL